jgi:succinate-acetate transporter protein
VDIFACTGFEHTAGWVFVVSAAMAGYVGTGMMLKAAAGHIVLPLFSSSGASRG